MPKPAKVSKRAAPRSVAKAAQRVKATQRAKPAGSGTSTKPAARGSSAAPARKRRTPSDATRSRLTATAKKPRLLAGGNPQIPMAHGDAAVQAYLTAVPDWKRDVARRLDALIEANVPGVRKAVKWNSPFYGIAGRGWFLGLHAFTSFVKATFFRGTSLQPPPPGGKAREMRWIDVREDDLDEAQFVAWVKQAAAAPGWLTADIR